MKSNDETSGSKVAISKDGITGHIVEEIEESIAVKVKLARCASKEIAEAASIMVERLKSGHKVIAFGNGGSAADAQHFIAELVGCYQAARKALAAVTLTANSCSLTAIGNDYGFEDVFSRQLEAIGKAGDVVLAISTSGNSPNVLRALECARKLGIVTIGLSGKTGGKMRSLVDICLCAPSDSTPRIQEAHTLIIHILCGIVENAFVAAAHSSGLVNATATQER